MKLFKPYTYLGKKLGENGRMLTTIDIFMPLPEGFIVEEVSIDDYYPRRRIWDLFYKDLIICLKVGEKSEIIPKKEGYPDPPPFYIWHKEVEKKVAFNSRIIIEVNAPEYEQNVQTSIPVAVKYDLNGTTQEGKLINTRIETDTKERSVPARKRLKARTVVPTRGADSVIIIS